MRALADYLVEIKPDPVGAQPRTGEEERPHDQKSRLPARIEPEPPPGPSPEEELASRLEAAYERGLADERARAAAALEEIRADARAEKEAALEQARATWAAEEGERLGGLLVEGIGALERRIADEVARVLAPVVEAAARERALADLARSVRTLLRSDPGLTLVVTGPADLGDAFLTRLGDAASSIRFTPGDGVELAVEGGTTVIETQTRAWARGLAAAIA